MKFAHEFQAALIREGFPSHWVQSAVPYSQLKKVIKKVTMELKNLGLDSTTLAQLVSEVGPGAFQYEFDGNTKNFQPTLTIFLQDGLAVDATLSPDTMKFLEKLVQLQHKTTGRITEQQSLSRQPSTEGEASTLSTEATMSKNSHPVQRIEVLLTFDSEFFETLQDEVANLDILQAGEQSALADEINALSGELRALTKPSRFRKTDMYRWRELFEIYLQAMVFFSVHELDRGTQDSTTAAKQLQWFQSEVMKRQIVSSFKLSASQKALERFININITLLRNIKFQEINRTAISKILKKFDKRTHLGAKMKFPKLIQSGSTMSETMAKAICSQVSQDLIQKVPQLDDYLCPVCFTIAWRPVRMKCHHVICISCAVTLQRKRQKLCPLCRGEVILEADADNIDPEFEDFLEKFFPKEAHEKRIAVETERGKEQFGESYKHPSEEKCVIM
ncbi:RING-14 protein [Amylocarpus encephaloides]|uniref:RING-14 protein n=1 Tax=Amylocarpus encephaloides TaxID=45428 RepID=A0A9P8C222_9HELO|nr:RING-14 protein [Amylocarpus encephaloides]